MPTPIAYQKMRTSSGIISIPIYNINDVSLPIIRIRTPNGIGAYDIIDATIDTPIRIRTHLGIKGINIGTISIDPANNLIDYNNYSLVGVATILAENIESYMHLNTDSNGNGIGFPFTANIGDNLECDINIDITQGVDDVISVRLWNITQNKWVTTNMKTGATTSGLHNLKNTYTLTSSNLNNGDQLELRIVQSWKNSTHDIFKFKVMKDSTLFII
jgi:hypothetical protein